MRAKRSLSQNFIKSTKALNTMVRTANLSSEDTVLEIGPGKGALTAHLIAAAGRVIALERDRELVPYLQERFKTVMQAGKLILIEGDILSFSIPEHFDTTYKVVANIPYHITGAILRHLLSASILPTDMVLLVQHEVAERIIARDGKESILSLSIKAYGDPRYIMKVPSRYFTPQPKVDSAIVHIANISRSRFTEKGIEESRYFETVKLIFSHKRKTILSNMRRVLTAQTARSILDRTGISPERRPETLTPNEVMRLTGNLPSVTLSTEPFG